MMGTRFVLDDDGRLMCSLCRKFLLPTLENFVASTRSRLGVSSRCRPCARTYIANWRRNNERLTRMKAESSAAFAARLDERRRLAPVIDRAHVLVSGMRGRAKSRGIPFDRDVLTAAFLAEWILRQKECECCGRPFRLASRGAARTKCSSSASIDRFVPARGYVLGNVRLICCRCNELKSTATSAELRRVADWMDHVTARDALGTTLDLPLAPSVARP